MIIERWVPLIGWLRTYHRGLLTRDVLAAVIVTLMLVPQALAYAMLAGLPPEMGLYASMLPLVLYAVFGTSASLAVGPVAVAALMTASALSSFAAPGSPEYICAALVLAALSGLILIAMGVLRLGFLVNFLSHPVISGFVTASGILIAISQLKHIFGVEASGHNVVELLRALLDQWQQVNVITLLIGLGVWAYLWVCRKRLNGWLTKLGMPASWAGLMVKAAPISAVVVTTLLAWGFQLEQRGVDLVGFVPSGLPAITLPSLDQSLWLGLLPAALLISLVGFVESVSVAQTLAAKRRQRIDPNQELIALGMANLGAGISGGSPVSGGFSRSVVNFEAGAATPLAGAFTALGIVLATLLLTDLLAFLPTATLAATIIVAVGTLIDLPAVKRTWQYSSSDGVAMVATLLLTLLHSVEVGIISGVVLSLGLHLYRTSQPHSAVVGRVPGTEHFRNVKRHQVETDEHVAMLRIDESLYFANARYLEDTVMALASRSPSIKHIVLTCQAVNVIDASALESLEAINGRLKDAGAMLHLAEVKGPVMDRLTHTAFYHELTGQVFFTTYDAWQALAHPASAGVVSV
ncbi:MAG: sodium-independent anion transporter [Halomonas sp.]|jgi:SulP family sulfate permease|uniref:SulP family inorganic anion transporter n=1 Tax=Vreelandella aquamarina TaxID=77097 RepID=UPI000C3B9769|nr:MULTISPECIES: sulfate permease [Halomonas]MAM04301.1 sodium-independent anion transporter [Halomonas sp.]MCD1650776.1 sulfate permease [Halomonas axialensis]MCD2086838.1 sulfate permease [Halomonas meridiana]HBM44505.1 sodium-independent anion transporter [Halomonas sp.]HBS18057.1 sodium-independent anion transporter [Halomonas sp.]|tara:strand:+ start:1475 stop:3208 length:1734 start_codon:yes stop_codon:yes gene_type:complete